MALKNSLFVVVSVEQIPGFSEAPAAAAAAAAPASTGGKKKKGKKAKGMSCLSPVVWEVSVPLCHMTVAGVWSNQSSS